MIFVFLLCGATRTLFLPKTGNNGECGPEKKKQEIVSSQPWKQQNRCVKYHRHLDQMYWRMNSKVLFCNLISARLSYQGFNPG